MIYSDWILYEFYVWECRWVSKALQMARLKGQVQWIFITGWHLLWDITKWINHLNFRCFFCNILCYRKLVFIHFNFVCLWNKPPTALNWFIFILTILYLWGKMVYLFNITTDVLSYAYQLLFNITHFFFSTFAAFHHFVLLFLGCVSFRSIEWINDRQVES